MTKHHSRNLLWSATIALLLPGCMAETGAEDEELGEESQALYLEAAYRFEIGGSGWDQRWGYTPSSSAHRDCDHMDNGVLRGWQLNEYNLHDFRWSQLLC